MGKAGDNEYRAAYTRLEDSELGSASPGSDLATFRHIDRLTPYFALSHERKKEGRGSYELYGEVSIEELSVSSMRCCCLELSPGDDTILWLRRHSFQIFIR